LTRFYLKKRILEILCRKIKQNKDIDLDRIVLNTPGYVGADLNALIDEALISSLDRRLDAQISGENSAKENTSLILNCNVIFLLNLNFGKDEKILIT